MPPVFKIFSGGQTGADRAALDFAIANNIFHGGWCPRGRLSEDGPLLQRYLLLETPLQDYAQRTEWNVRDSDATLVFSLSQNLSGGSLLTRQFAAEWNKPFLHVSRQSLLDPVQETRSFLMKNNPAILNVAGPRESREDSVYRFVMDVLTQTGLEYFEHDH